MAADGHEIACHGNRWRIHGTNTEQEKAHVHKSFDRLQGATGLKNVPTGWFLGNGSIRQKLIRSQVSQRDVHCTIVMVRLIVEQVHKDRGVPLLYCSDTYASDIPYYIPNPLAEVYGGKDDGMLMIPYSLCTNDHRCKSHK
jgi:peptidoglycan/xylan/chitin deacetylase (PgdA/CDA1 family)